MYIAMNRFKVAKDRLQEFETSWKSRRSNLVGLSGFIEFHMLKGADHADHVLYASHTVWADKSAFEAWTHSEAFRLSHAKAGDGASKSYLGHPEFEGFEVFQHIAA